MKIASIPLISIVDDDQSIRESLVSLIESFGFRVEQFSSAEEFLGSNEIERTDCLVLDIQMRGMNGLELQRELAARRHRVPIIFVTAHGDENQKRLAMEAGAVAFLRKPFSSCQMLRILGSTLGIDGIDE